MPSSLGGEIAEDIADVKARGSELDAENLLEHYAALIKRHPIYPVAAQLVLNHFPLLYAPGAVVRLLEVWESYEAGTKSGTRLVLPEAATWLPSGQQELEIHLPENNDEWRDRHIIHEQIGYLIKEILQRRTKKQRNSHMEASLFV